MNELLVNNIYPATEGEGVNLGLCQVFVRLQGCEVGCVNCDSKETWSVKSGQKMTVAAILEKIPATTATPLKRVSITGGNPLMEMHKEGLLELVLALKQDNYWVNIEASGDCHDHPVFDLVDFISFDLKTPSTEVSHPSNILENFVKKYSSKSQIKSIISDEADYQFTKKQKVALEQASLTLPQWCLTPCYEPKEKFPQKRFQEIIEQNMQDGAPFRVVCQQHKFVYGPNDKNS